MTKSIIHLILIASFTLGIVRAERDPARLTHGPMLGKPTAHTMTVWARTSDPTEFHARYGVSESNLDQVSAAATTRIENDNTGTVTLVDLQADQRYFYQVYIDNRPHGLPGSFLTLPAVCCRWLP